MKDNEWSIKKQVKIMVEKYSFDFFISKAYKMENVKEIFSMTIPGYPNLLDLKNFEAIFHENQMDIQKFTHPSITVSLGDVKIFNKYLIPSVLYEIDPIKRIKSDKRIDILTAKTETETVVTITVIVIVVEVFQKKKRCVFGPTSHSIFQTRT